VIYADLANGWLLTTLRADPVLVALVGQNIYNSSAPDELLPGGSLDVAGKATAYVVFDFVAVADAGRVLLTGVGSTVQITRRYQIKAVGGGRDSLRLRPVLRRIEALSGLSGDFDGHHFVCDWAEVTVEQLESADGHHWWHRGGQYDITAHTI